MILNYQGNVYGIYKNVGIEHCSHTEYTHNLGIFYKEIM